MNGLHPHTYPELYRLLLGTEWSPGTVTLSGHDRDQDWDVQKAKGSEGASSKLNGKPLGEFQATFYLAGDHDDERGDNDFVRWESYQKLIESTVSGPSPVALPVYHPDLARNGYTEVVLASMGGLVWDDRGGATVVVKFREHRPPKPKKPAKAKAKTAKAPDKPEKPDPNAAAKKELAALLEQAKRP